MKEKIDYGTSKIVNAKQLTAELIAVSLAHPGKAITACSNFGRVVLYVYPSLSRLPVDTPDVREMLYSLKGIAYVDGKLMQPTKGWNSRKRIDETRGLSDH